MDIALENAVNAMRNRIQNIQVVANNLANIDTTGFKRGLAFSEILDSESAVATRKLTDFSEGSFIETSNPMNAAISGKAYFSVQAPDGEYLTKNGDFLIDKQGYLANRDGYRVMGENGEINIGDEIIDKKANLTITKNGEIKADDKIIAKLKILTVEDQFQLKKTDGGRFYNDEKQYINADENKFEVHHGYLESSNTNAILEMQTMIQLQKDYEAASKMITSIDAIMGQVDDIAKI